MPQDTSNQKKYIYIFKARIVVLNFTVSEPQFNPINHNTNLIIYPKFNFFCRLPRFVDKLYSKICH